MRSERLPAAEAFAKEIDMSAPKVRNALRLFSSTTAPGGDQLHLRRLAALPDAALEQLGKLLKQSIATLTVPVQDLLNILALLGKNQGGLAP